MRISSSGLVGLLLLSTSKCANAFTATNTGSIVERGIASKAKNSNSNKKLFRRTRKIPPSTSRSTNSAIYVATNENDVDKSSNDVALLEDADGVGDAVASSTTPSTKTDTTLKEDENEKNDDDDEAMIMKLLDVDVVKESELAAAEIVDDICKIDLDTGGPVDEECEDIDGFRSKLKKKIGVTLQMVKSSSSKDEDEEKNLAQKIGLTVETVEPPSSKTDNEEERSKEEEEELAREVGLTVEMVEPRSMTDIEEERSKEEEEELAREVGLTVEMVEPRSMTDIEEERSKEEEEKIAREIGLTVQNVKPRSIIMTDVEEDEEEGDLLEKGWENRGSSSSLRRNAEVWKFALKCVFRVLKPRSLKKKGTASEEEIKRAQIDAAEYIRDGLLTLGPTFVKLGQVVSTRTDVLPTTYTDVLKSLQDDVPAFSGSKAKEIVANELGIDNVDDVFTNFSDTPLKAASLGQVHTAFYKGKKVAIKVQRAGLKELFDVDLKNLKKLAVLLDKFDPKSDGADRDWVKIYEESERLLYLEIDYLHEADNLERFANDFKDVNYVRVPKVLRDVTTPRVMTMEFIESFKLTDIEKIDKLGLDKKKLAKQTADAFLRQIVETSYFHCDPHPGNLCVDDDGNLVYYDFGMMDELKPNVREGFRKFCTALFAGGPTISDIDLAKNAKTLVDGCEQAGILSKKADRLAVEKLARFFMRSFKENQLGKKRLNLKETVGTDVQTLTENDSFRFPSTFTFIFRAFASVEGIGKGLDPEYDIGKLAQPFIEKFTESQNNYSSNAEKRFRILSKATGLNTKDIETAVTSPRKIAYIEDVLRSMETGELKVRVRSLENEKALERMALTQSRMENILLATAALNAGRLFASRTILAGTGYVGVAFFLFQAFLANSKVKKFDKKQASFEGNNFVDEDE